MARPEQAFQIRLVNLLRQVAPDLFVFHVPNGGKREKREAALLKAMGVTAGLNDLVICWAIGRVGFMELKSDDGDLSGEQKAVHARLRAMGFPVAVVRSVEEALDVLAQWGAPVRGRIAA